MNSLDLKGEWSFALDRENCGVEQEWFNRKLEDSIRLPGSLQEQEQGDKPSTNTEWLGTLHDEYWFERKKYKKYGTPDNFKIPYWLQPARHYTGTAWFSRSFKISRDWKNKRIVLFLERAHWSSTVWLDGEKVGTDDCLSAPHVYELGMLDPGEHTLSIRIDNRMLQAVRADAHSVTDSTQSNWNGIIGKIELRATSPVYLEDVKVFTDIDAKTATFKTTIGNISGRSGRGVLSTGDVKQDVEWTAEGATAELTVQLPEDAPLWDEFTPTLYPFTLTLSGDNAADSKDFNIGLRKVEKRDTRFFVNNRPAFFRGTLENCVFPATGYPSVDIDEWRRIFKTCKEYGLNHVRFHSYTPPEAAFDAADEVGIYLQPECSNWGQFAGDKENFTAWLERETERLVDTYGNHPSFMLFSTGNEPGGSWQEPTLDWCQRWKEKDPRFLYASQSGRFFGSRPGPVPHIDFLDTIYIGRFAFRGETGWHGRDFSASLDGVDYPVISHETGQFCAFPDFREIEKHSGAFRAKNFEIFKDDLEEKSMLHRADAFLKSSGMFQVECYKQDVEALLRTKDMGGFQLLGLYDYPGQGTALVGPLNVFWENKGYVTPDAWRRFCSTTVPLARVAKYVFITDETLTVPFEVAHFGADSLKAVQPCWSISDAEGNEVVGGELAELDIPVGNGTSLGELSLDLSALPADEKYILTLSLDGMDAANDWEFWLYPAETEDVPADGITLASTFDEALPALNAGGRVLLMPRYSELTWECPPIGTLPIFWCRLMGPSWERFLGLDCDVGHPSLSGFVTDAHYDWQWETVFAPGTRAINLDRLPQELEPVVQVIDDWNRNYKLAALFECRVGAGRLMVSAADLVTGIETRPAARQLRNSVLAYMQSDVFNPEIDVQPEALADLFFDNRTMRKLGATAVACSESHRCDVANVIDGNPNTYWLSSFDAGGFPHEVTVSFENPVAFSGLILMNRQDQRAHEGNIRKYAIQISNDGESWESIKTGELESTFEPQRIEFGQTVTATQFKIVARSGFGRDLVSSLSNVAVIYEGPALELELEESGPYRKVASATEEMNEGLTFINVFVEAVAASSEKQSAECVQDGDWNSYWCGDMMDGEAWIKIDLNRSASISGITYLPRKDKDSGRIKNYVIEVSSDGERWFETVRGQFAPGSAQQAVEFDQPVGGSSLRVRVLSIHDGGDIACAAEIDVQVMD